MKNKIIALVLGVALFVPALAMAQTTTPMTRSQMETLLTELIQELNNLEAQVAALANTPAPAPIVVPTSTPVTTTATSTPIAQNNNSPATSTSESNSTTGTLGASSAGSTSTTASTTPPDPETVLCTALITQGCNNPNYVFTWPQWLLQNASNSATSTPLPKNFEGF